MLLVWLAFPLAICLAAMSALFLLEQAARLGLVDNPGGRKAHVRVTPLIGGLFIWAGLWCLPLVLNDALWLAQVLTLTLITVGIGVLDDIYELSPRLRLGVHLLTGFGMAYWAGVELTSVGDLLGTGPLLLGGLAVPVTCFAVAAAMNAVNMVDGVDGLAGALTAIPVAVVLLLSAHAGHEQLLGLSLALAGGLFVFLLSNFPFPWRQHASCFLGDTGSTLLGLLVAWLLVGATQAGLLRPVFALFLLAIPLIDVAGVMLRRVLRGVSMSTAGRDHLHHVLIDAGMSPRHATYMIATLALLVASVGGVMEYRGAPEWVMFVIFAVLLLTNLMLLRSADRAKAVLRKALLEG